MEQITVERSILIDAPRERVWQALTEPAQIGQWFLPPALGASLTQDASGALVVSLGPMQIALATLEIVDAAQRVRSRGLPDDLLTVDYTLADEPGRTRVTVTMSGFEALPADARQDRLEQSGAAWGKALENLRASVAGAALPFPEGYVAACYGYRREPREALAVERSIWIRAPRERVWQALTDPKQVEQWFSPGTEWSLSSPGVGGRLFVRNPETGAEMYTQVIEQIDPPQRLATRSAPEPGEAVSTTAYTLVEEGAGTRLTITYAIYEQGEGGWMALEQHAFGFGMMLLNVKACVEGEPLPVPGGF